MVSSIYFNSRSIDSVYIGTELFWKRFNPITLFLGGGQGIWLDPSDLSTMYKDAAGTIPVTANGDPVGLIKDKSGNGNHATQSVSASRPTYCTDGVLHWLEGDAVDDFMVLPATTYLSGISICTAQSRAQGIGEYHSIKSKPTTGSYIALSIGSQAGVSNNMGGTTLVNNISITTRARLEQVMIQPVVIVSEGNSKILNTEVTQIMKYANTRPPKTKFFGYVEKDALNFDSDLKQLQEYMAKKGGVVL